MKDLRQEVDPTEAGLDPHALTRLNAHFTRAVADNRLPGYLLSLSRHGHVAHLTTHGQRDQETHTPVTTDTLWRIYSMTKPVTSVAALMLIEEGSLTLDTPLAEIIPSFSHPQVYVDATHTRPASSPLLIRHLMTHTGGLTFGFYHDHPVDALYREAGLESSVVPGTTLAETCEVYARLPLQFDPGTAWNYSVATNILGRVIEIVSATPLDDFLRDRVFTPLDMRDAGFHVTPEQAPRLAELYGETEDGGITPVPGLPLHSRPKLLSGSGGMVATARDYHRFMEFLRRKGELDGTRLLTPRSLTLMTSNHLPHNTDLRTYGTTPHRTPNNEGVGFGLGVSVGTTRSPGTYGWSGVASTTFWVDPAHDLTVQFLTQVRPKGSNPFFQDLRRLVAEAVIA
jgi:CubicO group peptidase (beta-lactamase class C family)